MKTLKLFAGIVYNNRIVYFWTLCDFDIYTAKEMVPG